MPVQAPTSARADAQRTDGSEGGDDSGGLASVPILLAGVPEGAWAQPYLARLRELMDEGVDAAAVALGRLGDKDARARLEQHYRDDPQNYFALASLALLDMDPYVGEALRRIRDASTEDTTMLAFGLVDLRDPMVIDRLYRIWQDTNESLDERQWAAAALVEMGEDAPVGFLEQYLDDPDTLAAAIAAGALLPRGHVRAREVIVAILQDSYNDNWDHAALHLGENPERDNIRILEQAYRNATDNYDVIWIAWALLMHEAFADEMEVDSP